MAGKLDSWLPGAGGSGWPSDHGAYAGMEALRRKSVKVICIDPVRTETRLSLSAELIAPRLRTDVAMMLGIAYTLYAEGLPDAKFLLGATPAGSISSCPIWRTAFRNLLHGSPQSAAFRQTRSRTSSGALRRTGP